MFIFNVVIFCLLSCGTLTLQQEILAFENCDVITCPVDCNVTVVEGEQCPSCNCAVGQRCPFISCPPEPTCSTLQRLDGCLSCSCSLATYEVFDRSANLNTFVTSVSGVPGGRETCNLYDIKSVQRCMKPMLNFLKNAEQKNANVAIQSIYSMFLYRQEQISELCDNYAQVIRCVSTDTLTRCSKNERHLHMMTAMFDPICKAMNEQFLKQYDCIHNVLVSHHQTETCSEVMSRTIEKAIIGPYSQQERRVKKCKSVNDFTSCVEPILRLYCGKNSSETFRNSLLEARDNVAPECDTIGRRFEAITVVVPAAPPPVDTDFSLRRPTLFSVFQNGSVVFLDSQRDSVEKSQSTQRRGESTAEILRKRCDIVSQRPHCPNNAIPQTVTRWFRRAEADCESYQYIYCNQELESIDRPLKFRQECEDICFTEDEKLEKRKASFTS